MSFVFFLQTFFCTLVTVFTCDISKKKTKIDRDIPSTVESIDIKGCLEKEFKKLVIDQQSSEFQSVFSKQSILFLNEKNKEFKTSEQVSSLLQFGETQVLPNFYDLCHKYIELNKHGLPIMYYSHSKFKFLTIEQANIKTMQTYIFLCVCLLLVFGGRCMALRKKKF